MKEIIERSQVSPANCSHLRIILDDSVLERYIIDDGHLSGSLKNVVGDLFKKTTGSSEVIARIMVGMKQTAYLWLELSFEKKGDQHVCQQCGQVLKRGEYQEYKNIFNKARRKGCDIWRIKKASENLGFGKRNVYKKILIKGKQKYRVEISRAAAAGIVACD